VVEPVPESVPVLDELAPVVTDAVGERDTDRERLVVELGVIDVVAVFELVGVLVGVPLPVALGETLELSEMLAVILALAPSVTEGVAEFDNEPLGVVVDEEVDELVDASEGRDEMDDTGNADEVCDNNSIAKGAWLNDELSECKLDTVGASLRIAEVELKGEADVRMVMVARRIASVAVPLNEATSDTAADPEAEKVFVGIDDEVSVATDVKEFVEDIEVVGVGDDEVVERKGSPHTIRRIMLLLASARKITPEESNDRHVGFRNRACPEEPSM
jgi:hypothetical protein